MSVTATQGETNSLVLRTPLWKALHPLVWLAALGSFWFAIYQGWPNAFVIVIFGLTLIGYLVSVATRGSLTLSQRGFTYRTWGVSNLNSFAWTDIAEFGVMRL